MLCPMCACARSMRLGLSQATYLDQLTDNNLRRWCSIQPRSTHLSNMETRSESIVLTDLSAEWPSCPCLSHLCQYDGSGFDGFLERQGWALSSRSPYYDTLVRTDGTQPTVLGREAVLQAWLFFGLAVEAFDIVGVKLPLDDLVKPESSPPEITMASLPSHIRAWQSFENDQSPHVRRAHLDLMWKLLRRAGGFVTSLLSYPLRYDEDTDSMAQLQVAESVAMLGDRLMNAARNIWHDLQDDIEILEKDQKRQRHRFCEPAARISQRLLGQLYRRSARKRGA